MFIARIIALILVVLWLWPSSLHAQSEALLEANRQGKALYESGQYEQAIPYWRKALELGEKEFGSNHLTANLVDTLARTYHAHGKYAEAEPLYKRALAIREKVLGPDHPVVVTSLITLALMYIEQRNYDSAEPLLKRALAIDDNTIGPDAIAPFRLAFAALEADEDVRAALGPPLSPSRLRIDKTRSAEPDGRAIVVFDLAGLRAYGTATAGVRKCGGEWSIQSLALNLADPGQPKLSVVTDYGIVPPLTELRRQVAAFGDTNDASLDAAVAYGDAQLLIDNHNGRTCDYWEARALFIEAARAVPSGVLVYIGLGRLAYKQAYISGRKYSPDGLKRAQAYLSAALDIDPNSFDAYFYRAYAYFFSKDMDLARDDAEHARELNPGSARTALLFAEIAFGEKDYEQAETIAMSIVATPGDKKILTDAYKILQKVYRARRQYDLVEAMYLKFIELDPDSAWNLSNYSGFLIRRGEHDKAIEFGEKALELMNFRMVHRVLAKAYYKKGAELYWKQRKHEEARPYFENAIKHDANHTNAHYGLGMSYYRSGNDDKLVADLERSESYLVRTLELDPDHKLAKTGLIKLRALLARVEQKGFP